MSNISNVEKMFFVCYQIEPLSAAFKDSLYQHLLDAVWGSRRMADEDIRVLVHSYEGESLISEIRYQFGEDFDEFLMREIGELIEKEISVWAANTTVKDVLTA